jgi:hypothetical protein
MHMQIQLKNRSAVKNIPSHLIIQTVRNNPSHPNYSSSFMMVDIKKETSYSKQKTQTNNQQATTAAREEMDGRTRWKVDEHIAKRPKLLIWSENTYKHKEKKKKKIKIRRVGGE